MLNEGSEDVAQPFRFLEDYNEDCWCVRCFSVGQTYTDSVIESSLDCIGAEIHIRKRPDERSGRGGSVLESFWRRYLVRLQADRRSASALPHCLELQAEFVCRKL